MKALGLVLPLLLACGSAPVARLHPISGRVFGLQEPRARTSPPAPISGTDAARFEAMAAKFERALVQTGAPGGAVALVIDGQLAFLRGFGHKRRGDTAPVTPDSLFRVASLTKPVLAAAALALVDQGRLALDQPITRTVPYFARGAGHDAAAVTLRNLLAHTAGLPDAPVSSCHDAAETVRAYFTSRAHEPFFSPPGEVFNYSNNNYALVAAAIAEATQQPFAQAVRALVFAPAGMAGATFDVATARAGDHVIGHGPTALVPPGPDCEPSQAAGGVYASVTDYARFALALLGPSAGTLRAMATAQAPIGTDPPSHQGLGLGIATRRAVTVLSHSGVARGVSTYMALVPERRFAVVAFANQEGALAHAWAHAVEVFLDLPPEPERPMPPTGFADLVGRYRDPAGWLGTVRVSAAGDQLLLHLEGGQPHPIPAQLQASFLVGRDGQLRLVTRLGVALRLQ